MCLWAWTMKTCSARNSLSRFPSSIVIFLFKTKFKCACPQNVYSKTFIKSDDKKYSCTGLQLLVYYRECLHSCLHITDSNNGKFTERE